MNQLKLQPSPIHIAHQSEVVELKKQMALMQMRLNRLDEMMIRSEVTPLKLNQKIKVPVENGFSLIEQGTIVYCKAEGNYTRIITSKRKYLISKTIKSIEELLDSKVHFRCHHSYLINVKCVESVTTHQNASVMMSNELKIPVSRRRKNGLIEMLNV